MSELQMLLDMGFAEPRAKKALACTKNNLGAAIDWMDSHPDDDGLATASSSNASGGQVVGTAESSGTLKLGSNKAEEEEVAVSLQCDNCGKQLRSEAECQNHAARTQHTSFSESTEAVKSLTPEEKAARLADLKEIMAQKRKAKEEAERAEAKAREMKRREEGKNIQTAKEYYRNQQAIQAAKEMREQKAADKAAKERVKKEIAKDKAERAARAHKHAQPKHTLGDEDRAAVSADQAEPEHQNTGAAKVYTTCRLQIRLPEGQPIVHTFQATDSLSAVYEFIQSEKPEYAEEPFSLSTTFPRHVFAETEKSKSLSEVSLVPSSVLVMARLKRTDDM